MSDAAPQPSQLTGVFKRPFAEQVAFFRQKLGKLVPTARWDDLWKAEHDRAFMVAGAVKADLLADLAAAVDQAILGKSTLERFRQDFRAIVAARGWHGWTGEGSKGGEAWRTRIIYTTNCQTSYSAGRLAQLRDGGFALWVYRHNDSVLHPRPQHLAWNGLTLPPNHPFWQTHYPPNGWGCKCYVLGARDGQGAARLGGRPAKQPPAGWDATDPKTGEQPGIDRGWGYMPGATVSDTVRALAPKLDRLPAQPSIGLIQSWLASAAFASWYADPQGDWPLARLPDADAQALGAQAGVRVARMSGETAGKQKREHPELTPEEYAAAQEVIDNPATKVRDGASMIYVRELPGDGGTGGYVLVVKATRTGNALWLTSYRRLSRSDALREAEIARLLKKGGK